MQCLALLQVVAVLLAVTAVEAIELNEENYEKLTSGKTVFLKFFDPTYVIIVVVNVVGVQCLVSRSKNVIIAFSYADVDNASEWPMPGSNWVPSLLLPNPS